MSNPEIRIFSVDRGRDGDINYAILCNGLRHYVAPKGLNSIWRYNNANTHCDGKACQGSGSEVLDISLLDSESQETLGLEAHVPTGMVLAFNGMVKVYHKWYDHAARSGALVTPKLLEIGTLLADGEGTTYVKKKYSLWYTEKRFVYYVRNVEGEPKVWKVGKEGRKRTKKKLANLRGGERKSEVSYDVSLLNARLLELMQLHRTPEVIEEIENVKELLRLASSFSIEASIEAAEGNEAIARELANSRAREIGAELQQIRERLMFEKTVREEVRKELSE